MAKKKKTSKDKEKKEVKKPAQKMAKRHMIQFGVKNYIVGGAGLLSVLLGFVSLAKGSITLAPILLVLGYCVLMPVGILLKQ
jgi:hypothetical protein